MKALRNLQAVVLLALLLIICMHVFTGTTTSLVEGKTAKLKIDNRTRKIVDKFTHVVTKRKEKVIAEKFLTLAASMKKIADSLGKVHTPATKLLKNQLLAIVKDFIQKAKHPSADLLKASLKDVQKAQKKSARKKNTLWVHKVIVGGALVAGETMNFINGLGTYSKQISNVARFMAGPMSKILGKLGLSKIARAANKVGSAIDRFTQKRLAPIENKAARAVAPLVKNKAFQVVRKTLNVVNAVLSFRAGFKLLGLAPKILLPKNFKKLKLVLKTATKLVKNRKKLMSAIKKGVQKGVNIIKNKLKSVGAWKKIQALNNFKNGFNHLRKAIKKDGRRVIETSPRKVNRKRAAKSRRPKSSHKGSSRRSPRRNVSRRRVHRSRARRNTIVKLAKLAKQQGKRRLIEVSQVKTITEDGKPIKRARSQRKCKYFVMFK